MKNLKHLNKYFWKYKFRILLGFIFVILHNVTSILPAQYVREALDGLQLAIDNKTEYSALNNGLKIVVAAIVSGFFLFLVRQIIALSLLRISTDLFLKHFKRVTSRQIKHRE